MINLVKNALKFTNSGFITISASFNFIDESLIVHIRDSGQGIEKKDIDKLFKRFGKLEQTFPGQNNEGIGLGLAICEAIISQNEGYIEVQS